MITTTIIVGFGIFLINLLLYKNTLNPLSVYTLFFTICTGLASLRLRGEFEASSLIYGLILISISSFFVAYVISYAITKVKHQSGELDERPINYKILYFMAIISLAYTGIKFYQSIPMYMSGMSIGTVRGELLTESSNAIENFLDSILNSGIRLALIFIVVVETFFGKRKDIKLILLVGFNVLMFTFTNGGRLILYDTLVIFLACFLYWKKVNKVTIKSLKKYIFPGTISVGSIIYLIIYLTSERQSDMAFWEALYSIFTCFLPLMDQTITMLEHTHDLTLGTTFFSGFLIPINTLFDFLNFPRIADTNIINKYDVAFFHIGGGNYANAYTSHIFYFYLDGRIPGVILGNILFAAFAAIVFKYLKYSPNKRIIALYLFVIYLIFRTIVRWQLAQPSSVVALIILFLIFKSKKSTYKIK